MVLFFKILAKKNDYIVQYPKSQVPALSLTCDFGYRWMPNSNQNHTIPNVAIFSKSGNWPILSNQNLNGAIRERERERGREREREGEREREREREREKERERERERVRVSCSLTSSAKVKQK